VEIPRPGRAPDNKRFVNSNKRPHPPACPDERPPTSCLSYTTMFPTPRSASLPTVAPPLPSNGLNVFHPIARKDSRSIAPMTPPMSPTDSESRMDDMAVDHPVPHSTDSDVDHLSLQDSEIDAEPLPIQPPIRTLDESRECLPRSLRLTDFEVRGTLGTSTASCRAAFPAVCRFWS